MNTKLRIGRFRASGLITVALFTLQVAASAQSKGNNVLTQREQAVIAEFEEDARYYVKLRDRLNRELPKLSTKATPEEIEAHKMALQRSVQASRAIRKRGKIFTKSASQIIAAMIKEEFKGRDLTELRKTVAMAETKGVPLKVNVPYPEDKELLEMSPALLLVLPKLPDHLRYRFVNRNLLLVDEECGLIIDFMPNAFE